jgi:hypothetical protein
MGVHLRENFNWPYLARTPTEYWRRWHISLSTWIRDYLYRPLVGENAGTLRVCASATLAFALAGLWHGASWKFIAWGLYIGLWTALMTVYGALRGTRLDSDPARPFRLAHLPGIVATFHVFCLSKLMFRADSVAHARELAGRLTSQWFWPLWDGEGLHDVRRAALLTAVAAAAHVLRGLGVTRRLEGTHAPWAHGLMWAAIAVVIALLYPGATERFIYFQF